MKILLVSSDQALRSQLHQDLSRQNFTVDGAATDGEAWDSLQSFIYDVVVLEAMVPQLDGVALCRRLRAVGNPVLILLMVASADGDTRAQWLDCGADAWLEKPIQEVELLAYIRALGRRGSFQARLSLGWGPLSLNPVAQQITCHGQVLKANRKEYQILELFLRHPRQMFSRSEIGDRLWALDEQLPTDATIKSHIRSIRRKLEQANVQDMIQTHYGQGYCLNPTYASEAKSALGSAPLSESTMDTVTANLWQELMAANARLQQEIEQRKQIEAQLRRSETMLRNAQQVAQIGCWEFDVRSRKTFWTEEMYLIHGLDSDRPAPTAEEVVALIHPDDRYLHEQAIRIPALRGEPFEANLRIIRADGEVRYVNARGGPLLDEQGQMVKLTGTSFDVTRWIHDGERFVDKACLNF